MYHNVTRKPPSPPEPERKERVIHTRVPESLEVELRHRAQDLGMSVSNLVRNVLGHAFGLVGDMVADSHAIARAARGDKPGGGPAAPAAGAPTNEELLADVLGWQAIILGKNALCLRCNGMLPRGSDAATGTAEQTGTRVVICGDCLEEQRR